MRSTFDILSDLAPKWQLMSEAEKVSLGTTLAGVNQYKVFAAVLNNFSTAIEATNESLSGVSNLYILINIWMPKALCTKL